MATSAEEALSRAKAIAAKLSGSNSNEASESTPALGTKRKRWGVAPAPAEASIPGLADVVKRIKTEPEATKRLWVNVTEGRPETHFFSYLPDRLGRIAKDVSNGREGENVSVELKGRGANGRAPLPGVPEEPMNVVITGPASGVALAEPRVTALLEEADRAPVENAAPLPPADSAHADGPSSALTVRSSSYRPATVAQMISNNPLAAAGDLIEDTLGVPNGVVGFVIGRGGENIASLQARTGCRVQIQKEHDLAPGQTERTITLSATSQEAIDECKGLIKNMVEDRIRAHGGSGNSRDSKVNDALAAGHILIELDVPDADVGLIIGKGGSTVKQIQETTGSMIQVPQTKSLDNPSMRTISITNATQEGAELAKQQIEEILRSKPSYAMPQGPQITYEMAVPDKDVGLCIGRGGCVIKEMQRKSNTRIQIPSQPTLGQPHRIATIVGTQEGVDMVKGFIERIIAEQTSNAVMGGPTGSYGADPASTNHQSAEWQAFYAAQAVAGQATAAQAPSTSGGGEDYLEQFFRYAYYYGEHAARQYYGAWAPPEGTPNPYGVNPNLAQAAPTQGQNGQAMHAVQTQDSVSRAGLGPASTDTATKSNGSGARETSARKVSNLPAWMTKKA